MSRQACSTAWFNMLKREYGRVREFIAVRKTNYENNEMKEINVSSTKPVLIERPKWRPAIVNRMAKGHGTLRHGPTRH